MKYTCRIRECSAMDPNSMSDSVYVEASDPESALAAAIREAADNGVAGHLSCQAYEGHSPYFGGEQPLIDRMVG